MTIHVLSSRLDVQRRLDANSDLATGRLTFAVPRGGLRLEVTFAFDDANDLTAANVVRALESAGFLRSPQAVAPRELVVRGDAWIRGNHPADVIRVDLSEAAVSVNVGKNPEPLADEEQPSGAVRRRHVACKPATPSGEEPAGGEPAEDAR